MENIIKCWYHYPSSGLLSGKAWKAFVHYGAFRHLAQLSCPIHSQCKLAAEMFR